MQDANFTDEGRVYFYYGSASGLPFGYNGFYSGNQENAHFGYSLSTAGDVNGDRYSDFIVSAPLYDNIQINEGFVFVYYGSNSGLSNTVSWSAGSSSADAQYGISVSTAGDVNSDGYSDIIVGAHLFNGGQTNEGRVYVYKGSPTGLISNAYWTWETNQTGSQLGLSVACAGDVNGDGFSDVA
ncbi:MAG: integrin alpha [Ignavibacteria bacterium]